MTAQQLALFEVDAAISHLKAAMKRAEAAGIDARSYVKEAWAKGAS